MGKLSEAIPPQKNNLPAFVFLRERLGSIYLARWVGKIIQFSFAPFTLCTFETHSELKACFSSLSAAGREGKGPKYEVVRERPISPPPVDKEEEAPLGPSSLAKTTWYVPVCGLKLES